MSTVSRVCDADFQTVLESVGFKGTPRETHTIITMMLLHDREKFHEDLKKEK